MSKGAKMTARTRQGAPARDRIDECVRHALRPFEAAFSAEELDRVRAMVHDQTGVNYTTQEFIGNGMKQSRAERGGDSCNSRRGNRGAAR